MKYIKIYTILFFASFIVFSCTDKLDIEPRQSISEGVALSTPENVQAVLIGAYSSSRGSYNGALNIASDLLGSSNQLNWNGTFDTWREMFNKAMTSTNGEVFNIYRDAYNVMGDVNLVLDNLNIVTDANDKNRIEGEAKFLRGLMLFDLVRLYGKPYVAGTPNSQLGVSIVLTPPSKSIKKARNTVAECYAQLLSDLNDAYNLLPATNGVYADKYTAQAVLAKVYLQMQDYPKARDAANNVIASSGHSLMPNFAQVWDTDSNNNEYLFSWVVTNQESSNASVTHYATEALGGRGGDISVTSNYLNKFDSNADQRRNFFYASGGEILVSKYRRQFANAQPMRLAEMYLIRAEANFRESTSVGATPLADLTTVRSRSSAPNLAAATLPLILNERELELGFEGIFLHDAKRTQANVGALTYDSDKLVLPIPRAALDANDLLVQNPGYAN